MRLRVAKKVHLGRSCHPGDASRLGGRKGCHKCSTIERATATLARAVRRGSRLAAGYALGDCVLLVGEPIRLTFKEE